MHEGNHTGPGTIALRSPAGFSLTASARFLLEFAPVAGGSTRPVLNLAFPVDGTWEPVGVTVRQSGSEVAAEIVANTGAVPGERIAREVERILSLDTDAADFEEIGRRDPVVADLQSRYPGLRPVQFATPYEAATWAIIGHRIRIVQAAGIKNRLAAEHGTRIDFADGETLHAFPSPDTLRGVEWFPGLTARKIGNLHALAEAALAGELDSGRILESPVAEARARLELLPGIGPFSSELIVVRGAGVRDHFPQSEPRLHRAMARLYGTDAPAELERVAEAWRPYRSWVAVLIRRWLEDETHEIDRRRD